MELAEAGTDANQTKRIAALERAVWKAQVLGMAGVVVGCLSWVLAGYLFNRTTGEYLSILKAGGGREQIVETRVVTIVDEDGQLRAHLGAFGNGMAELTFFGEGQEPLLTVGAGPAGEGGGTESRGDRCGVIKLWDEGKRLLYSAPR